MQELLRWEIATKDKNSIRTAKLRELHTLPLCKKFADAFAETEIDIVAISALIIGGIYYMILHCELSEFSGINLNNEQDRERMIKVIKYLANILFQTPSYGYSTIKIASKSSNANNKRTLTKEVVSKRWHNLGYRIVTLPDVFGHPDEFRFRCATMQIIWREKLPKYTIVQ